jgi:hypothetical protein
MAQVIKIKRSTGSVGPSSLAKGELAYSGTSKTLFIGDPDDSAVTAIGSALINENGTASLAPNVTAAEIRTLVGVDATADAVSNLETNLALIDTSTTIGNGTSVAITTSGNLTVTGDLVVSGDTTTVNTATLSVEDPLIILANNNAANSVDIGFYGKYIDSGTKYAGLFRDAGDGKFRLFKETIVAPSTTVDTGGTGYSAATLVANVEGNLTIGGHAVDDIDITSEASDADDHLMTALAIKNRIEDYNYGDIISVQVTSTDLSITGVGTASSGAAVFDLQVGTIDGGTYS